MNFWWVNHRKSFKEEIHNGNLWISVRKNVSKVKAGDYIFSYAEKHIQAIGITTENPKIVQDTNRNSYERENGWSVKVSWTELNKPFETMKIWNETKHLFRYKYVPLKRDDKDRLGYLYRITEEIFITYCEYIQKYCETDISRFILNNENVVNYTPGFSSPKISDIKCKELEKRQERKVYSDNDSKKDPSKTLKLAIIIILFAALVFTGYRELHEQSVPNNEEAAFLGSEENPFDWSTWEKQRATASKLPDEGTQIYIKTIAGNIRMVKPGEISSAKETYENNKSSLKIIAYNYKNKKTVGTYQIETEFHLENIIGSEGNRIYKLIMKLVYDDRDFEEYISYTNGEYIGFDIFQTFDIEYYNDSFVIIRGDFSEYSKGATRGPLWTEFYIIDLIEERILNITDIITEIPDELLKQNIETNNEIDRHLRSSIWPPDSIDFGSKNLILLWNIFSITSYSNGIIEIKFPYDIIEKYLTEKGLLIRNTLYESKESMEK
jgi:hypothetical protein